jgi:hypothetical protein
MVPLVPFLLAIWLFLRTETWLKPADIFRLTININIDHTVLGRLFWLNTLFNRDGSDLLRFATSRDWYDDRQSVRWSYSCTGLFCHVYFCSYCIKMPKCTITPFLVSRPKQCCQTGRLPWRRSIFYFNISEKNELSAFVMTPSLWSVTQKNVCGLFLFWSLYNLCSLFRGHAHGGIIVGSGQYNEQ